MRTYRCPMGAVRSAAAAVRCRRGRERCRIGLETCQASLRWIGRRDGRTLTLMLDGTSGRRDGKRMRASLPFCRDDYAAVDAYRALVTVAFLGIPIDCVFRCDAWCVAVQAVCRKRSRGRSAAALSEAGSAWHPFRVLLVVK